MNAPGRLERESSGALPDSSSALRDSSGTSRQSRPAGETPAAERPVLEVRGLRKYFPVKGGFFNLARHHVHAVDGVDLEVRRGETLALVGESGCGKSTVGRSILGLTAPDAGEVTLNGTRIDGLAPSQMRPLRRHMQVVFQDPFASLNPRMRVRDIVAEPIVNFDLARDDDDLTRQVTALLERVGLPRDSLRRFPHEFSGGQRQRIGIARALAPGASLIVCDEAVSALDVSVKAQIVNLLARLQDELGLALLFISHDLAVVEHLAHRVAVMYLGRIVETGEARAIFARPRHPYTQALLSAVPQPRPGDARQRIVLRGDVPDPVHPPSGCRFHTRCPYAFDRCRVEEPQLRGEAVAKNETAITARRWACHLDILPSAPGAQSSAIAAP